MQYLDFEKPIEDLSEQLEKLQEDRREWKAGYEFRDQGD